MTGATLASPTITRVQGPAYANYAGTSVTASFSTTPTPGNLLIALGRSGGSVIANASIPGWSLACSSLIVSGGSTLGLWYKVVGAGEAKDVTLSWTNSTVTKVIIEEWSGLSLAPLDQTASAHDTGSTVTNRSSGTTPPTTFPDELCLAGFGLGDTVSAESWSHSFAREYRESATPMFLLGAKIVSTTGTCETTLSWTTARRAGGLIATFKAQTTAAPTVRTTFVSSIAKTTVSGGGNVTADGGSTVTGRGVCWNTTGTPTITDPHTHDGSGTGAFTSSLTGLTEGTKYYIRAWSTNANGVGTAYGKEFVFVTITDAYHEGLYHTDGRWIKDHAGRIVTLKGVNVYARLQNEEAKFAAAKALGANVIRLAFWKSDIESPGARTGQDYRGLAALDDAIGWAKAHGLKVILDQHIWTTNVEPCPPAFFTDTSLQESWLAMWALVLNRYSNEPTVIGIDPMNEPWATGVGPAYRDEWEAIVMNAVTIFKTINPRLLYFVEGWSPIQIPSWRTNNIAVLKQANVVYSDHLYYNPAGSLAWNVAYRNEGVNAGHAAFSAYVTAMYKYWLDNDIPLWLGEIGFDPSHIHWQEQMEYELSLLNSLEISYTLFVFGVNTWSLSYDIVDAAYNLTPVGELYRRNLTSPLKRTRLLLSGKSGKNGGTVGLPE